MHLQFPRDQVPSTSVCLGRMRQTATSREVVQPPFCSWLQSDSGSYIFAILGGVGSGQTSIFWALTNTGPCYTARRAATIREPRPD